MCRSVLRILLVTCLTAIVPGTEPGSGSAGPTGVIDHAAIDVEGLRAATVRRTWAPWLDPRSGRPYRLLEPRPVFQVGPRLLRRFDLGPLADGLQSFDHTPGSALDVELEVGSRSDAAWRITAAPCPGDDGQLAQAEPRVAYLDAAGAWVDGAEIVLCLAAAERSGRLIRHVVAHELAHVLGLGHTCGGSRCRAGDAGADPCTFMYPTVHPCQEPAELRPVVAALYPAPHARWRTVTPRSAGHGPAVAGAGRPAPAEGLPPGVRR